MTIWQGEKATKGRTQEAISPIKTVSPRSLRADQRARGRKWTKMKTIAEIMSETDNIRLLMKKMEDANYEGQKEIAELKKRLKELRRKIVETAGRYWRVKGKPWLRIDVCPQCNIEVGKIKGIVAYEKYANEILGLSPTTPETPPQTTSKQATKWKYEVTAWVHPKQGGDDYKVVKKYGDDWAKEDVEKNILKYLKRVSNVTTDYTIKEITA